jgi:hypothetical protein
MKEPMIKIKIYNTGAITGNYAATTPIIFK